MVSSASPPDQSRAASVFLSQIANELAQDQNLTRIKKLLLYVCNGTWETNRHHLERASLAALLQRLIEIAPTFEQLQQQLNQAVASLNKSTEYTLIANTVINCLHAMYVQAEHSQTDRYPLYQAVAQQLEQDPEQIRIKKLLLLTCRNTWEGDTHKLEQLDVSSLVQELRQIAPTLESLRATLYQVAGALSKPEAYTRVAERIGTQFQALYLGQANQDWVEPTQTIETQPPVTVTAQSIPTLLNLAKAELPQIAPEKAKKPALKVLTVVQPHKTRDLFNLRLQIMQDANPFKVKILLFSLLHEPFQWQTHEAMLKNHELDELLRVLFLSYRLYSEAASDLSQTARSLGSEQYLQTAEAILRAIQPCYSEAQPALVAVIAATLTDITCVKAETSQMTLPDRRSI